MAASKVVAPSDKNFAVLIFQYKSIDVSQVAEWKLEMTVGVPRLSLTFHESLAKVSFSSRGGTPIRCFAPHTRFRRPFDIEFRIQSCRMQKSFVMDLCGASHVVDCGSAESLRWCAPNEFQVSEKLSSATVIPVIKARFIRVSSHGDSSSDCAN